jgi:hypothetical protein
MTFASAGVPSFIQSFYCTGSGSKSERCTIVQKSAIVFSSEGLAGPAFSITPPELEKGPKRCLLALSRKDKISANPANRREMCGYFHWRFKACKLKNKNQPGTRVPSFGIHAPLNERFEAPSLSSQLKAVILCISHDPRSQHNET